MPGWPMISMQVGLAASASLNWLIIVSGAQAENCAFSVDPERLGGFLRAGLAGERRAVAGVAAHLHVHREPLAERVGGAGAGAGRERRRGDAGQKKMRHRRMFVSPLHVSGRLYRRTPSFFSRSYPAESAERPQMCANNARRRCGSSDVEIEDDREPGR